MNGADVVEHALSLSRAEGCIVLVTARAASNLRWANSTMTTNGAVTGQTITVISVVGQSVGVASATDPGALAELVAASEAAAREATPAEDAGPLVSGSTDADFATPSSERPPEVFADLARALGRVLGQRDGIQRFGYASHEVSTVWLGSSTGLRRRHVQPTGYLELTARSARGSAWSGQHTRDWSDIDVERQGGELARRLAWGSRQRELPAGRYEVLLPPSAVADLLAYAYWSSSGRSAAEGRTAFSRPGGGTRVGERLGPAGLVLASDPHDPALATIPFVTATASSAASSVFDNGLPLSATRWIDDGVLSALVQTRSSAAATGAAVTPYVDNLVLDGGGTASTEAMVASTGRGLLLTSLWYIREVDPRTLLLTGLTRDGVYLVEDGEVVGAVNNFRWNESPLSLLGRVGDVGRSVACLPREWSDDFTWTRMPTLRVPDFHMSSVSQAS